MKYLCKDFLLRPLVRKDFEIVSVYENTNRLHLEPWEPFRNDHYFTLGDARDRVARQVGDMEAGRSMFFLILNPENEEVLGRCNYTNIVKGAFWACNLGFSLAAPAQGKRIMGEALKITNAYSFEQIGLHRIMANHLPRNRRSERLLESLGFEKEGYARAYLNIAGVWEDHVLRSLINPIDTPR
ncbi:MULTISPECIES: GNAT family N-acetyltransferase [Pseudomonas]|uniref:GNAT family N-acetyltransferase n=1 Tax=Pseudomonas quercus TaxID=2722792 RepID=A0ABX0Y979_9PSED|nr:MULTISPECIES: GNAT family N-acetyltransferase [Pseudomonas]MBF7140980.1 GNAT family N-acetyltransferase [Pseudomonas sp. LY10J]NJO99514.1 GNAT family N-acetyltransferase [Pseudomonas quercus]